MSVVLETPTSFHTLFSTVTPHSPGEGRRWVISCLAQWHDVGPELADALELFVSELLTNVCLHAAGAAGITLTRGEAWIELAVADQSPATAHLVAGADDDEHHRGLLLIEGSGAVLATRSIPPTDPDGFAKEIVVTLACECTGAGL